MRGGTQPVPDRAHQPLRALRTGLQSYTLVPIIGLPQTAAVGDGGGDSEGTRDAENGGAPGLTGEDEGLNEDFARIVLAVGFDLEAVEVAVHSAMHRAGAAAVTELLQI